MKIGIIGATGKVWEKTLQEAIKRGLDVTAIVRDAIKNLQNHVQVIEKNILELTKDDIKPFDVVINTFAAPLTDAEQYRVMGKHLIAIFKDVTDALNCRWWCGKTFC